MGGLLTKVLTPEGTVLEALKRGNSTEAAELIYRLFIKDPLAKLEPTLLTRLSQGQTTFSLMVLERKKGNELLFLSLMARNKADFDKTLISLIKSGLAAHEVAISLSLDTKTFSINGALLTKM
jgi:hypothetical protein